MRGTQFTAPAGKVLTVLHIISPDAPWVQDRGGGGSTNGETRCGLPMLTAETWQLIEQLPGEAICPRCLGQPDATEEALF